VLFRGVSLTIVRVLSLCADLSNKVREKASQACGWVISIHLNEIKDRAAVKYIVDSMLVLPLATRKPVTSFTSRKALVDKPHWKLFVTALIFKKYFGWLLSVRSSCLCIIAYRSGLSRLCYPQHCSVRLVRSRTVLSFLSYL